MAYHGYIPMMMEFLQHVKEPRILEIGVDRGQTTIPLLFSSLTTRKSSTSPASIFASMIRWQ